MKSRYLSLTLFFTTNTLALPQGFVYLHEIDPTILQDMRYAGYHNFVGRPIQGYEAKQCILTRTAALALAKVQAKLKEKSLTLKVYDCYRPTQAVNDFMTWSKNPAHQEMKAEFYPHINKADMFELGYVAKKSGHSRGSTIDLTLVPLPVKAEAYYHPGQKLVSCIAAYGKRYKDNSLDMGTGYDCMDTLSYPANTNIKKRSYENRKKLWEVMIQQEFVPYEKEWWHFTLKDEPYPNTYFNFPVK